METCTSKVVVTFESVDEILWRVHSNKISLAVLLHGAICFAEFAKIKFGDFRSFYSGHH